jgi:hypothetical protein
MASKLRDRGQEESRKEYVSNGNGKRKQWAGGREFFEVDAPPAGVNTDIWHLAVFFKDKALELGVDLSNKKPIIYGILQNALTKLNPPAILARARDTTVIDTTSGTTVWVDIVENAIIEFLSDDPVSCDVSTFGSPVRFEYYIQTAIDTIVHTKLVNTGKRIPQPEREVLPSRRTEEQKKAAEIRYRRYSEQELLDKMKEFRSRNN